jgi:hypothetical protein
MPTNTYVALDKVTLGSATNTISFTSIPQTYTDLVVVASVKATSGSNEVLRAQVNSDTGSNYSYTYLQGVSSGAESARASNSTLILAQAGNQAITETANTFAPYTLNFMNYSNTTTNKTILARGAGTNQAGASVSLWRNTAAITSIRLFIAAGNFDVGSTFSLYGIAATSVGAKATGGIISSDDQYYYHTFASTGTFTPLQSLTCDYLVVAGGGGGFQGGGGAGGLRCTVGATGGGGSLESPLSLTATGYTVTVGAGGAAQASGNNSVFSTITATAGGRGGNSSNSTAPATGGSGGGGGGSDFVGYSGAAGTANQGYAGGNGAAQSGVGPAGGGGGSNSVGTNAASGIAGNGGSGVTTSISGTSTVYAGGGGGGIYNDVDFGIGGTGGGGNGGGGNSPGTNAVSGTANTGSGGGGAGFATSGAGGSGLVIVRYAK